MSRRAPSPIPKGAVKPEPPPAPPRPTRLSDEHQDELHRVGDVEGLRLSANGLEWLRRMAKRELQEREAHLAGASPFIGQSDRSFAEAYAKIERKVVFLQDLLSAIERAKISTT